MARLAWRMPGFRLDGFLGAGASGEVWRARVSASGAAVALKRIPMRDDEQRRAALAEAAVLSALDHPHLLRLYEVRRVDESLVLVLDLATGGSLADLLAARGRITPGEAITAVAPIAAAVAYAHTAGIVHGDITPANVLFTDDGVPLLADLGVARLLGSAAPVRTTPAYADPAVAVGGLPAPSSDVFMLGGLALHALTGEPTWPSSTAEGALGQAAAADCAAERRLADAGVPEPTRAVLTHALAADPFARPTAAEFALDLRHAGDPVAVELGAGRGRDEPVAPGRPAFTHGVRLPPALPAAGSRHRRLTPRAGSWPARRAGRIAVVAAVLLVSAFALAFWWPQHRPSSSAAARSAAPPDRTRSARAPSPVRADPPLPRRLDGPSARQVLDRLDALRATAFARRAPRLLGQVYAAPQLRARDTAQLLSLVPAGCGLHGARTSYGQPRVVRRATGRVWVTVAATLRPSTLMCAGTSAGHAPPSGRTTLRIELTRTTGGWRMARQRAI